MDTIIKNTKIREFYNKNISDKYKGNYEYNRWHTSQRLRLDYFMMHNSISNSLSDISFNNCLEFGPGPGTWTRLLYRKNPSADFDLIDISEEMKKQFSIEMRDSSNVNYNVADFLDYDFNKSYDFFFSSRALEYLEDQELFFKKLSSLIKSDGVGVLVTKNPQFRFRTNDSRWQHTGQISMERMKKLLEKYSFRDIQFYPAIIRIPLLDRISDRFSEFLYKNVFQNLLSKKLLFFTESYIVTFSK